MLICCCNNLDILNCFDTTDLTPATIVYEASKTMISVNL